MKAKSKKAVKAETIPAPITKAEFNKLSRPEQRVIIAQDVLAQLALKKFKPMRGYYCSIKTTQASHAYDIAHFPLKDSAQKLIQSAEVCHVCAKGAMVCAYVSHFNKRTVGDMRNIYSDTDMINIFGQEMWSELEAQFEGDDTFRARSVYSLLTPRQRMASIKRKSLKALMQNIIKNKGFLKIYNHLIG